MYLMSHNTNVIYIIPMYIDINWCNTTAIRQFWFLLRQMVPELLHINIKDVSD